MTTKQPVDHRAAFAVDEILGRATLDAPGALRVLRSLQRTALDVEEAIEQLAARATNAETAAKASDERVTLALSGGLKRETEWEHAFNSARAELDRVSKALEAAITIELEREKEWAVLLAKIPKRYRPEAYRGAALAMKELLESIKAEMPQSPVLPARGAGAASSVASWLGALGKPPGALIAVVAAPLVWLLLRDIRRERAPVAAAPVVATARVS